MMCLTPSLPVVTVNLSLGLQYFDYFFFALSCFIILLSIVLVVGGKIFKLDTQFGLPTVYIIFKYSESSIVLL